MTNDVSALKPPTIPLPPDPMWAVWIWRQDSQLLARMRPILAELVAITEEPCLHDAPTMQSCVRCRLRELLQPLTKGTP